MELEPFVNEAPHRAMFMSGNISGLGCGGGLAGSLFKKKGKVAEGRADMLNVFDRITEEGMFNHCLQVEFFSEWVKWDGYDTQVGAFGVAESGTEQEQGHQTWRHAFC